MAPRKPAGDKNTGRNTGLANLKPAWKKGQSGNPKGRPVGARDRRTVIWEALKRIAEKKNMLPEEIEEMIQVAGVEKAIKGSFLHYSEVSNGLYGKITDNLDIKSGGKSLADLIAAANHERRTSKRTQAPGKNQAKS
jgi:hypothetical protein